MKNNDSTIMPRYSALGLKGSGGEMKNQVINKRGDLVDDSDIIPDGCGIRVHMMLQDSVQQSIATNLRVTDAWAGQRAIARVMCLHAKFRKRLLDEVGKA